MSKLSTGTMADQRPFLGSVFTLETMGRLAQYVYYDQEQLALLSAVADTMAHAQARPVPGSVMKNLVDMAASRNALLAGEALVSELLPALPSKPISAFRAELYRHAPSGELTLVFRGSQEGLDWLPTQTGRGCCRMVRHSARRQPDQGAPAPGVADVCRIASAAVS
jgi:hypothetical protein